MIHSFPIPDARCWSCTKAIILVVVANPSFKPLLTLQGFAGRAPRKAWLRQPSSGVWLLPYCSREIVLTRTKHSDISCRVNPQLMLMSISLRSKPWSLSWGRVFFLLFLFIIRIIHQANKTSLLGRCYGGR